MKKILKYTICLIIALTVTTNVNALELDIKSKHAILYNTDTNEILYQKEENEKVQIASLTKIMTAIITLENVKNLDDKVTLKSSDFKGLIEENLVTAGFRTNQTVTYRDLLYGLLLPSGADAAKALARTVGGNEANFIKMMNQKVKDLELKNTNFSNPIGLDDENNYSTAKEISDIFKYALENEEFKTIVTTESYTTSDNKITFKNKIRHNVNTGTYLLGGKTGTTSGAGLCLASIAEEKGVSYLLVTTGAIYDKKGPHNFNDAKTIYEYFIDNYSNQKIIKTSDPVLTLKTKYSKEDEVSFYINEDIELYLPNNYDKSNIKYKYTGIKTITPKIEKGTKLGVLDIYNDQEKIKSLDIILEKKQEFSIIKFITENKIIIISISALIILLIIFTLVSKKHKTKRKNA